MQSSGNRGSAAETLRKTSEVSWAEYRGDPLLQAYAQPPTQEKGNPFVSMKMKSLPAVRKEMLMRGTLRDGIMWPGWFGKRHVMLKLL